MVPWSRLAQQARRHPSKPPAAQVRRSASMPSLPRPVSGRARRPPPSPDQEESDDYDAVRRQERLPRRIPSARARERQREREAFLEEQERVGDTLRI